MLRIRSLNNATTLVTFQGKRLLIDPWLVGDLYLGAWSPYSKLDDLEFLKEVDYVYISHIHEDHWDLATLSLVNREAKILIPDMPVNNVIVKKLARCGFGDIKLIKLKEKHTLSDDTWIKAIPPLNSFGQESWQYIEGYESDAANIDSSLFLQHSPSGTSHLFLCDNTPYDINLLQTEIPENPTTLWYPYNGYAQDYPVCYTNITSDEKKSIHDVMHKKRISAVTNAVNALKPKYYLPHSADFTLNGPASKPFYKYVHNEFMDRKEAATTYKLGPEGHTKMSASEYLDPGDELIASKGNIKILRNIYGFTATKPSERLPTIQKLEISTEDIAEAFRKMKARALSYHVNLQEASDWCLVVATEANRITLSFSSFDICEEEQALEGKYLEIHLSEALLASLLTRNSHWNNCMIGFHLTNKRVPNEYCHSLYKALNFFHL